MMTDVPTIFDRVLPLNLIANTVIFFVAARQADCVGIQHFRNRRPACGDYDGDDLQRGRCDGTGVLDPHFLGSAVTGDSLRDFCCSPARRNVLTIDGTFWIRKLPSYERPLENCGSPAVRFSKVLNLSLPFWLRHFVVWPATLQIVFKNDAKCSFSYSFGNLFS